MAMVVVDASVVAARFIADDPYHPHALSLFSRLQAPDVFLVPENVYLEITNLFWELTALQCKTTLDDAKEAISALRALPLRVVSVNGLYQRALHIGVTHSLPIYDALYIALAERYRCALITGDSMQEKTAIAEGVKAQHITTF